jgi:excisionase family DNA binding protein
MSQEPGRGAMDPQNYPVVMDVPMVAEMLLTDANQVRKWANAGLIPCHRVPGTRKYRFMRDEILSWLANLPGAGAQGRERAKRGASSST